MSVISKYNRKTWTDSERVTDYIYDEQFYLEIHHNNKKHQQNFVSGETTGVVSSNAKLGHWLNWSQFESNDGGKFYLQYLFNITENGEYWVEVLYHANLEGTYPTIWYMDNVKEDIGFRGSDNFMTRYTKVYNLQKGEHTFKLALDPHLCVLGVVLKKIDTYGADNTLSRNNILTCIGASHTESDKVGADEFSFELLYDNDWKDPDSLTDFLFDFRDEVNFSVMNNIGEMEQIFGGYVSSCTLNSDETVLTVKCAGRLVDGDKRYVVEEMNVGGDASVLTDTFRAEDIQRFVNYNDALDYLFANYETILQSNMEDIFKEKEYESIDIDVTRKEIFDRIETYNMTASLEADGVYLRNKDGSQMMQSVKLYDSDWFNSEPYKLDSFPIFYMTYGMGEPMTTQDFGTSTDSNGGVSSDGSVINVRMKPSCGCCAGTPYQFYEKSWKNYCTGCGRSGTLTNTPKGWGNVPEGEITCGTGRAPYTNCCDRDYCGYCGGDKYGHGRCRTTKLVPASASENANTGNADSKKVEKSQDNVFQTITDEAFRYQYRLGAGSSSLQLLLRLGYGDCFAFSELIYARLVQAGVGAKIVQYPTSMANNHRSVMFKNATGEWEDFPYRKYGWGSRYNNMLNNTSNSSTGTVIASTEGVGVNSETSTGTVTNGFDKDKQFMAWIRIEYSESKERDASRGSFYIDFTGQQSDSETTFRGFAPISLNNITTTGSVSVIDKLLAQWNVKRCYLRSISLEYMVQDEALWENAENSTDNSSYRMILKNVGFRNGNVLNPTDLGSTGKSVNGVLETVLTNSQLKLKMYPSKYRKDDRVIVGKKVETDPKFTVLDGQGGNLLDISNWSFTPVSDYINRSLVVFKSKNLDQEEGLYNYLGSRRPEEIMSYGEISDLVSISDDISPQEAYYESLNNPNYDNKTGYAMTVTVAGCPADLQVGDFVEVVLEDGHYTDYKEVKSINHVYDVDNSPKLTTKIGLNKPERSLALKDEFEAQRRLTKTKKAVFGSTATYNKDEVFKWED